MKYEPIIDEDISILGFYEEVQENTHIRRIRATLLILLAGKLDNNGKLLSPPYHVGIVTSPAPNASVVQNHQSIRNAMTERIQRILYVFQANEHDTLVLGAFDCGVFQNNPLEVAQIFKEHVQSNEFHNSFKRIIFALSNPQMCQVFKQVFDDNVSSINDIQQLPANISINTNEMHHDGKKQKNRSNKDRHRKSRNDEYKEYSN